MQINQPVELGAALNGALTIAGNKGDECGKRADSKENKLEQVSIRGDLMLIDDSPKDSVSDKKLVMGTRPVEKFSVNSLQDVRCQLGDCTNTRYVGEGGAVVVKKSGTKGQWRLKARFQGLNTGLKEEKLMDSCEPFDRKRWRSEVVPEDERREGMIPQKKRTVRTNS